MSVMKIGKITRMREDGPGYLKEAMPFDKEIPSDFKPRQYVFNFGKIDHYHGEYVKELNKMGLGVNSIVAFWTDDDDLIERVSPLLFEE